MSTIRNILLQKIFDTPAIPIIPAVRFLLALKGTTIAKVAKRAGVTPQAGYADIKMIKKSPRFRAEIKAILKCIPWDFEE